MMRRGEEEEKNRSNDSNKCKKHQKYLADATEYAYMKARKIHQAFRSIDTNTHT